MSRDLPTSIDPLRLAHERATLVGSLPLSQMERIQDSLCDNHGDVYIHWSFFQDDQRRAIIQGQIQTQLSLQCQRCLQPMNYPIDIATALVVVMQSEDVVEESELPAGYELLELLHTPISLLTLVEDELVLALPIVVMHEQCPANEFTDLHASGEVKYNPFHILTQLKQ